MTSTLSLLYVDDDDDVRAVAMMALELDEGLDVRGVASGAEALAFLDADPWRPDAIMLDVMMPEIDGPALATMLRAIAGLEYVPVLFMTARARAADYARYHELGAAGVIAKPFDPLLLAAEIRRILAAGRPPG